MNKKRIAIASLVIIGLIGGFFTGRMVLGALFEAVPIILSGEANMDHLINVLPILIFALFLPLVYLSHFVVAFYLEKESKIAFKVCILLFIVNLATPMFIISLIGMYGLFNKQTRQRFLKPNA